MTARIALLVTSPRLPAGLLSAAAWDLVRAHPVWAGAGGPQVDALRAAGCHVELGRPPAEELLAAAERHGTLVWLAGPDGDGDLARELGLRLAREPGRAELELIYGSWDPPGARLLDAVAVIDRLVSPGGDPWKREQTHETLARYLLEECYEAFDAIASGDLAALRDELGDLLLQVVLHARLAQELPEDARWSVDDVAAGLVDKMVRRNPHVFAGAEVTGVDDILANWERIKQAERPRASVLDGIPLAQPALSLATAVLERLERAGRPLPVPPAAPTDPDQLGAALLGLAGAARAAGEDPEAALRRAVHRLAGGGESGPAEAEPGGGGAEPGGGGAEPGARHDRRDAGGYAPRRGDH